MAKKQTTKKVEVAQPEIKATNEMTEVVIEDIAPKKASWEIKDRMYYLVGKKKPLSRTVRSSNIFWFDEEKGYERELKYCQNQKTPFVDEMVGDQRLEHIVFRNGMLFVEKEKTTLQKLLSLYHPMKDQRYKELIPQKIADDEIDAIEWEIEALNAARNMDIDVAEAIVRVEYGSKVNKMSSKELKRDLLLLAKQNPKLFLSLAADENVQLRNFAINAVEANIIRISPDNRSVHWSSNDRKLINVPFEENPYSAIAAWFKTDEGIEVFKSIEKRL